MARVKSRYLPDGSFGANVLVLMTGTTIAQAVPILVSPVLTRLYSPRDFGVFAVFIAIVSTLAVVATARYELAVMLPEKDEDSVNLLALAITISAMLNLVVLLIVTMFGRPITSLLGSAEMLPWLYLVPPMVFLVGLYQTLTYWANRKKQYKRLSVADVTLKTVSEGAKWGLGLEPLRGIFANGLVVGYFGGQTVATGFLGWQLWKEESWKIEHVNRKRMLSNLQAYKKFPMYNVPYSVMATFSNEFIFFALSAFSYLSVAGFLGLTRRVVIAPISFLSSSLGRVFFQEAAVSIGTPELEELTNRLMLRITEVFTPFFVFLVFWAPEVFGFVFGEQWVEAGWYASVMAPAAFCFLYTSWPERIYEVTKKQHISFLIQLVSDTARISIIWGLLYAGIRPIFCVLAYSIVSCFYHATYLLGIFKVARFQMSGYYTLARKVGILATTFAVIFYGVNLALPDTVSRFLAGILILSFYHGRWVYLMAKQ